ncbi:MAG: amino acid ABC transporter substrate-binding protein, partial [Pseudomonadota bacterium]
MSRVRPEVKMKKSVILGALSAAGLATALTAGAAAAGTLDDVKARGK